jgi:hypothetical protein
MGSAMSAPTTALTAIGIQALPTWFAVAATQPAAYKASSRLIT